MRRQLFLEQSNFWVEFCHGHDAALHSFFNDTNIKYCEVEREKKYITFNYPQLKCQYHLSQLVLFALSSSGEISDRRESVHCHRDSERVFSTNLDASTFFHNHVWCMCTACHINAHACVSFDHWSWQTFLCSHRLGRRRAFLLKIKILELKLKEPL